MLTYGDGVCDVDLGPARLSPRAGSRRHRDRRSAARAFGGWCSTATSCAEFTEKPQMAGRGGSTAGSSSASPELRLPRRRRLEPRGRRPRAPRVEEGSSRLYRHERFWQCMDTLRDKRLLEELWERGEAPWLRARNGFWRDRPTLVTGATGLVGGWLVRRPDRRGADVVCLVRDWVPQARARPHGPDRAGQRRARRRARPGAARARPRRVRDRHRHPPRGADDRADREPQPGLDVRDEHRRHLVAARGLPRSPKVKQIVVASSDKAYGDARRPALRRGRRRSRPPPLRRQQVVRRPDRAELRHDLRPAGRDHALRQLLRRRRPELEPHRARDDPLGPARRAAGHPLRTASTSATTSTSRTAPPPTCSWPSGSPRTASSRARRSTSRTRCRVTVLELVDRSWS